MRSHKNVQLNDERGESAHVLKLGFRRVLTKGAHYCAQLLAGDRTVAIYAELRSL